MPEGVAAPLVDQAPKAAPLPQTTPRKRHVDPNVLPARLEQPYLTPADLLEAAAPAPVPTEPPSWATETNQNPQPKDSRRVLPPRRGEGSRAARERPSLVENPWAGATFDPMTTAAALAMVVGLFMLTATFFKKAAPKSQRLLPNEVAAVLGRIPLGGKQVAHLLKVGSKLVLVCITPEGVKPLTEVSDPAEVTRLLGLCEQSSDRSATAAFQDVFEKLASEPAAPGFLGDESPLVNRQQLAAAYAQTPGGRASA